jgi:hypothetical protein
LIALNQTSTYALGGRPRQLSSVVVLSALDMAPSSPADRRFYRPPTLYPAQILDHVAAMIAGLLADQDIDPRAVTGIGLACAAGSTVRVAGARAVSSPIPARSSTSAPTWPTAPLCRSRSRTTRRAMLGTF